MKFSVGFLFSLLLFLVCAGCTEKYPVTDTGNGVDLAQGGCVACHTDRQQLKAVADPLPPPPDGGGSGEG